ncbi:unnamed protein product [Caenorhabditis auriculariae]|uniref:DNA/RNA-binding protein Kin17 WH-like domain-containing protein n=1 Tax=Caenorhabditis auriculariae TaxID=2777116 RepID=A0A8S1H374_9PELO|nr:unnamed protein product [Caenorhabditis auriculariae]
MGKHEKGTPKEIANRSKSRGLQKLRWFCQMCQKQCRDENGFKCHLTSESHQRQLLLFAENSGAYLRQFSNDFEKNFMQLLRTTYGSKRVRANEVYNDYIKDKGHVHMNATVWHSLTGFVQYLGNTGKCKIDQGEKGWYLQYIDQEAVIRKEEELRKVKQEKDDEDRHMQMMEDMVKKLNKKPTPEELARPQPSSVSVFDKAKKTSSAVKKEEPEEEDSEDDRRSHRKNERKRSRSPRDDKGKDRGKRKKSALDEILEMEEQKKERKNRKDYWLHEGIVVKVMTKSLGSEYYKTKGVVKKLIDDYTANIKLDDGTLVKLDQEHVETVIPSIGRRMLIVNGAYRDCEADLDGIDEKNFCLNLTIASGIMKGRTVKLPYEDASKLA